MRSRARRRLVNTGLALALMSALPALAHHAWNEVDTATAFKLFGTVRTLHWENPHASLVLTVPEGEHKGEWTVLMSGLARMESRDLSASKLAVGRALVLVVSPSRGDAHTVRANTITVDGKDHVLY